MAPKTEISRRACYRRCAPLATHAWPLVNASQELDVLSYRQLPWCGPLWQSFGDLAAPMIDSWYFANKNQPVGPFKLAELKALLEQVTNWEGLMVWVKETMLNEEHNISEKDLELFKIVETADEAVTIINEFYSKYLLKPNF